MDMRKKVVPFAYGEVLEVGIGPGLNLSLYNNAHVTKVWGLEPSIGMRARAKKNLEISPVPVEWLDLPGEQIPLSDNSVDSIVLTYTLCTIPDWQTAMQQMHRVLKPEGHLLFCEHGKAPEADVQKWQDRLNPLWKKIAGGCNLNRPVKQMIENSGFAIQQHNSEYLKKSPRFASYMTYGQAVKNA